MRAHDETLQRLAEVHKQINAPVGQLGLLSLRLSTLALESNAPGDGTSTQLENRLTAFTEQRNALATRMIALLEAAAFRGQAIDEQQAQRLVDEADELLKAVSRSPAGAPDHCS
jgi:hypothetical protein